MFTGLRLYAAVGAIAAVLLLAAWAFRVDHLRAGWKTKYETETYEVTARIGNAIGNPKLRWGDVPKQIELYADGHNQLIKATNEANAQIDAMGRESDRLLALNADLRAKADKIIKERAKLIDRLAASAKDPGQADDCQAQIAAAEAALDAIYEEGL